MITTQVQYHAVASRIEQIKDATADSIAAKELKILTMMIIDFENRRRQSDYRILAEQYKVEHYRA